jgi:hypothetical protein
MSLLDKLLNKKIGAKKFCLITFVNIALYYFLADNFLFSCLTILIIFRYDFKNDSFDF